MVMGCLAENRGSLAIIFTYCNLMFPFCQNYEISHLGSGSEASDEELAVIMLDLVVIGI